MVVGGNHERQMALRLEPKEEIPDDLARLRIQVAGGLVGEDQPWPADERAGDRDTLLLTSGQLPGPVPLPVAEPDLVQRRG